MLFTLNIIYRGSVNLNTTSNNSALSLNGNTIRVKLSNGIGGNINYTSANLQISLSSTSLKIDSINTDKKSPQSVNSTIKISTTSTANVSLTYKFWIHDGSSWKAVQDFSSKDYYDWTPTSAGTYKLWIDVKDSSGNIVSKEISYIIK